MSERACLCKADFGDNELCPIHGMGPIPDNETIRKRLLESGGLGSYDAFSAPTSSDSTAGDHS